MLALGLWGLDRGGMWGDEGVTFMVGRRTVPQIWHLLHGVDAVHGLYYLLMHAVLTVHPGEVVLRLPSLCGAAATAGLVAALGTRLARPRVGLWAGLLYAITPLTGHYAQEGRSYALVAAGVAAATLFLVRALEGRSWWPYGAVLAVTFLLHEFAVLVLCAHAVTLAAARVRRAVWRGWIRAVGVAGGVLIPLVWVSERQSAQVAWLRVPDWDTTERLARDFLAVTPTGVVFWTSIALILIGLGAGRLTSVALPLLLLPPVILLSVSQFRPLFHERYVLYALAGAPLLVAAGADRVAGALRWLWLEGRGVPAGRGAEAERAVAEVGRRRKLVGAVSGSGAGAGRGAGGDRTSGGGGGGGGGTGIDRTTGTGTPARAGNRPPLDIGHAVPEPPTAHPTRPVHRSPRRPHRTLRLHRLRSLRPHLLTLAGVLAVAVPFLHGIPAYRNDRSADRRPENLAAVAALVGREVRPGDPVLFLPSFWRVTASAYPGAFVGARDLASGESGARSGTLSGREVGPGELRARLAGVDRVWIVAQSNLLPSRWVPGDPTDRVKLDVVDGEFARRQEYVHGRVKLALYLRRMPPQDTPTLMWPPASAATPAPPPPTPAPPPPRPTPR
ncbi:glycosyltransferase family 39 protein [Streptomyces sp. NBC_00252]|uniref:glycosyltransferase family 39 protein n=1 Tax=Streptomyces sp. NBC_00252 TaxID=2975691 RepID=UPI002E2E2F27|nr:glycosyltransferase family 39 protein [Streptomyces sp. NBC_00252]